jgi:hypothetical protein
MNISVIIAINVSYLPSKNSKEITPFQKIAILKKESDKEDQDSQSSGLPKYGGLKEIKKRLINTSSF